MLHAILVGFFALGYLAIIFEKFLHINKAAIGAGISPQSGLYTAIIAGLIISCFGGSRVQIGGPSSTFIVMIVAIIAKFGFDGMLVASFLAGVILIIFASYNLGTYIKYIPYPVVTGLIMGITMLIFITQIKDLMGLPIESLPTLYIGCRTCQRARRGHSPKQHRANICESLRKELTVRLMAPSCHPLRDNSREQ